MKLIALTGLSKESLDDLVSRGIKTFEMRSTHNIIAFSELKPGDQVYVTDVVPPDLSEGQCGVVAMIRGIDIRMHRVSYGYPGGSEEVETMAARVQLKISARARIRQVNPIEMYKPITIDAFEIRSCEAR